MAGAVVVLAVAAGASSCAGRADRAPGATVPDASTTSTTVADDWTIPETIDAAYVERVLAELDRIDGDAARIIVAEGELVPAAVDRLRAIYGTDELNLQLELWGEDIAKDFAGIRRPPGNRQTSVTELIDHNSACISAEVRVDYSTVAEAPPASTRRSFATLGRSQPGWDPQALNPTGWVIESVRVPRDGSRPDTKCSSS